MCATCALSQLGFHPNVERNLTEFQENRQKKMRVNASVSIALYRIVLLLILVNMDAHIRVVDMADAP